MASGIERSLVGKLLVYLSQKSIVALADRSDDLVHFLLTKVGQCPEAAFRCRHVLVQGIPQSTIIIGPRVPFRRHFYPSTLDSGGCTFRGSVLITLNNKKNPVI